MKKAMYILLLIVVFSSFFACAKSSSKDFNSVSRVFHIDIDSEPRESDVYWRVLSRSDEVSSTNRFHLGKTPLEATQSLRIPNLNKGNSVDVEIVIEIENSSCRACRSKIFYLNAQSLLNSRGISLYADLKSQN